MVKNLSFRNSKGYKLLGRLHVPKGKGPFPLIIISHGMGGSGRDAPYRIKRAEYFCRRGFLVYRYSFTGHDQSPGVFGKFTASQGIDDLKSAIKQLSQHQLVDKKRINLWGVSMGAKVSSFVAAADKKINSIVLVATLIDTFSKHNKWPKETLALWKKRGWIYFPNTMKRLYYSYRLDAKKRIGYKIADKIKCPVMMIHGANDFSYAPVQFAKKFYKLLKTQKKLVILPKTEHKLYGRKGDKVTQLSYQWFSKHND